MRRNSVSSLGSFIQHEVDFSCSVCARRQDRYNENERRLSVDIDSSSLFRERVNRSGENGVSSEGRDISGFTGVSTREVSAVLTVEEEEEEEEEADSFEKVAKSELEKARTRQEREKYIMEAILTAKEADARRPSKHLKIIETEKKTSIDDVIKKKPSIRRTRGVADSKEEGNEEPLTLSMIERRLEALRSEELQIRERVRVGERGGENRKG